MEKYLTKNNKSGFTLVEMMVAIAVFSVVMVVAATALLSIIDANQKAQTIKTAINNINFTLEGISKDARMGTNFECLNEANQSVSNCLQGGVGFRYKSNRAYKNPTTGEYSYAYYRYNQDDFKIESCLELEAGDNCATDNNYFRLTSEEIKIIKARFYVIGAQAGLGEDKLQPRLVVVIEGIAGTKNKTQTTFDLQTTVSQRVRNNN